MNSSGPLPPLQPRVPASGVPQNSLSSSPPLCRAPASAPEGACLRLVALGAEDGDADHTLRVFMVDAGVVLDKLVIDCGGVTPSYLGPADTRAAPPR